MDNKNRIQKNYWTTDNHHALSRDFSSRLHMQSQNLSYRHCIIEGQKGTISSIPQYLSITISSIPQYLSITKSVYMLSTSYKTADTRPNKTLHGFRIRSKFQCKCSEPKIFIFKMINTKDCTAIMLETTNAMILKKYNDKVATQCVLFHLFCSCVLANSFNPTSVGRFFSKTPITIQGVFIISYWMCSNK